MLKVKGVALSPFVRKVRVFIAEKGLEHDLEPMAPFPKTKEFLALSPLGKIPVFEDDGFVTPDSSVICAYLERTAPKPALFPADAKAFARSLWYEEYADTRLSEVVAHVFFQRVVRPSFFKEATDESVVQRALTEEIPDALGYLEGQIGKSGHGIVDDAYSVADIAICAQLVNLEGAGERIDAARWPNVARYVASICGRPAFRNVLDDERRAVEAA